MLKTNYDTNSKGLNIEVSAFLDTDASQINFNDNIEVLQYSSYNNYSVGFYTDCGQIEVPEIQDLLIVKGKTRDIKRFLVQEHYLYKETIQNDDRESVINELIAQMDFSWNDIAKAVLHNENISGQYLMDYGIDILLNEKQYKFVETRGYSQGDYAICIVKNNKEWMPSKDYIDDLYWNAPIYFKVTINDIELDESDILDGLLKNEYDTYNYDKDKVIAKILSLDCIKKLNRNEEIKEELENLIPDEIQYQY